MTSGYELDDSTSGFPGYIEHASTELEQRLNYGLAAFLSATAMDHTPDSKSPTRTSSAINHGIIVQHDMGHPTRLLITNTDPKFQHKVEPSKHRPSAQLEPFTAEYLRTGTYRF